MVPSVRVVPGTVRKVCQLTGEHDRERGEDTTTRTETNYGLFGTDLGSSFEHGGRLWFLFGDTWPSPENHPVSDTDSVAWTTATEASRSLLLTFVSEAGPGGRTRYKSPVLTDSGGVRLRTAGFEVPIAGFSAREQMYIFYSVDAGPEVGGPGGLDALWIGHDGAVVSALANPNIDKARWQPASGLTPPGAARGDSSLACVTRLEGALDVFWIGPDGAVATTWANPKVDNGGWHPPFPITPPGAARTGSPVAAVTRLEGALDVFWIGPDGAVATTWANPKVDNGGWHPPFPITQSGAARDNSPVAADTRVNGDSPMIMGRTMLARAIDNDPTNLRALYDMSRNADDGRFINVAVAKAQGERAGLPIGGEVLLAWGSGRYRASNLYLAYVPLGQVESPTAWRFFAGYEDPPTMTQPLWSADQHEASPLFVQPQIGELSAAWIAPLGVWLMLYNAGDPRGINGRVSSTPWGPWSDPIVVFDPGAPGLGYGHFMHVKDADDGLADPGRKDEWAGEYGPYIIDRFTRDGGVDDHGNRLAQLCFVMSTWNPYNTVLMTVDLQRDREG